MNNCNTVYIFRRIVIILIVKIYLILTLKIVKSTQTSYILWVRLQCLIKFSSRCCPSFIYLQIVA